MKECYQHGNMRVVIDNRADEPIFVYEKQDGCWNVALQSALHDPDLVRDMLQGKFRQIRVQP